MRPFSQNHKLFPERKYSCALSANSSKDGFSGCVKNGSDSAHFLNNISPDYFSSYNETN